MDLVAVAAAESGVRDVVNLSCVWKMRRDLDTHLSSIWQVLVQLGFQQIYLLLDHLLTLHKGLLLAAQGLSPRKHHVAAEFVGIDAVGI